MGQMAACLWPLLSATQATERGTQDARMHILGGLLAAIGVILVILWRMQQAAHAARDVAETAG